MPGRPARAERHGRLQAYRALLGDILAAISTLDPCGLLAGGAPASEFEMEAAIIAARLRGANSPDQVAAIVRGVLSEMLGDTPSGPAFDRAIDAIWAAWCRFNGTAGATTSQ